jgi:hypothetical protein
MVNTYLAGQFMEFSVNLTKLGLDPVTLLGGNACGMPFRRVLVKSRASTSFTAELKDFVGPFDFFIAPRAEAAADIYLYCGTMGVSNLSVTNAVASSIYTWTTPDGHIVGSNVGSQITVDMPGMYIVTQQLQSGCPTYGIDTVYITYEPDCGVLANDLEDFRGQLKGSQAVLDWSAESGDITYFELQRSTDGLHFTTIDKINPSQTSYYTAYDDVSKIATPYVYYRIKMRNNSGMGKYSKVVALTLPNVLRTSVSIGPNPVRQVMSVSIVSPGTRTVSMTIHDAQGKLMRSENTTVQKGHTMFTYSGFEGWPKGMYVVKTMVGNELFVERMILRK